MKVTTQQQLSRRARLLRKDVQYATPTNLPWDDDGIRFLFGYDAKPNLVDIAASLGNEGWKPLRRLHPAEPKTARRSKRPNYKQHVIKEKEYLDKRLIGEWITEFDYQPGNCNRAYRMIAVRKRIETACAGERLFEEYAYFFTSPTNPVLGVPVGRLSSEQMNAATRRTRSASFMHRALWQLLSTT